MRITLVFLMAWLLGPGLTAWAADLSSIKAFLGDWKGDPASLATETLPPAALDLRVQSDTKGFRLSWHDLGTGDPEKRGVDDIDASFLLTERPGVYEYAAEPGSLLTRMFASPSTANPLDGETLLWARVDDQTLAVYSMTVDRRGDFNLDHYSWTRTEKGLRLKFSKRTKDLGVETMIEGDLVAEGG